MAELKCIAESSNPDAPAILFIHGLNGHASQTWMYDNTDEKTLWPKWLADDFDCSVYLVHYDATLSRWKDDAMPLADQGDALVGALQVEAGLKNRPLILVGHSMGGLVIKTAIQSGLSKGVIRNEKVIDQIRGVVFVGTPHNGSQLATLVTHASVLLRTNTQVKNMQTHDAYLRSLNQQFRAYCSHPPSGKVSVRSFTETRGVFLGKKTFGVRVGPTVTIVAPNDGDAHIEGEIPVPLDEDHISLCKLPHKNKLLYKSLLSFLKEEVDLSLQEEKVEQDKSGKTINMNAGNNSIVAETINGPITMNNN